MNICIPGAERNRRRMIVKNNEKKRSVRIIVSFILALTILTGPSIPAFGALTQAYSGTGNEGGFADPGADSIRPGADYIVSYRDGSGDSGLMSDQEADDVPFDVVSGRELQQLLRDDCLEWFEEDGDAVLLEGDVGDDSDSGIGSEHEGDSDVPDDPENGNESEYYNDDQWHLAMIGAEAAARQGYLGQGVRVGVLDSGVNPHPDLSERLQPGHNYIADASDVDDTSDSYGHGTKVAGLIAAFGENGQIGAAPKADLVPLKVTDGKSVKISAICRAIYGAVDDYDCDVINLSLGVNIEYRSMQEAVEYAESKGVVMVSAAGNNGNTDAYYPAAYKEVIGVGSVDRNEVWYYHSNHNDSVFLTAPGADVRSTTNHDSYDYCTGSSFAVPQVSGAAAVILGIDGTLEPSQVRGILAKTARDKGAKGYDEYYGYGIPDIGAGAKAAIDSGGGDSGEDPADKPCDGGPDCALRAFFDLDCSAWYHHSIHYVLDHGIMAGYGGGRFGPEDSVSRAMAVTLLWRMDGGTPPAEENPFEDVKAGSWYEAPVRWAAEHQITSGVSKDSFAPDDPVTREQFMTFLHRFSVYRGEDGSAYTDTDLSGFNDEADISAWADKSFRWAVGSGLIRGTDAHTLSPKGTTERAQAAAICMRYEQRLEPRKQAS